MFPIIDPWHAPSDRIQVVCLVHLYVDGMMIEVHSSESVHHNRYHPVLGTLGRKFDGILDGGHLPSVKGKI